MAPKVALCTGMNGIVEDYLTGEIITLDEARNASYHICEFSTDCEIVLREAGYIHFSDQPDEDCLSAAERYYEHYTPGGTEVDYYPWKALDRQNPGGMGG